MNLSLLNENQLTAVKRSIQTVLKIGVVPIKFEKADKSERTMNGTLSTSMIPGSKAATNRASDKAENLDVVHVFDVTEKEWRCFRLDRLISVGSAKVEDLFSKITTSIK